MLANATPLVALDAVALDTETTGLDTAKARIVQIGAVRIVRGRILTDEPFERLVAPGEPIPAGATRIHGIADGDVSSAPDYRHVHDELVAFLGTSVIIGHSIGFDIAILRREARLAGKDWTHLRCLDTRMLAELANPRLPGFSIDIVASWLGIEVQDRHSAVADAVLAARVFAALVPRLRERDIRTLAEAEAACRKMTDVLDEHYRAGWVEPAAPDQIASKGLARIDSYPYRHRVKDVMSSPPVVLAPGLSLAEAIREMTDRRISSAFLGDPCEGELPRVGEVGIVTERDVLRAIARHGAAALEMPVSGLMSKPVASVPEEAYLYRAVGRMDRRRIRHLAVASEDGVLVGALSQRDLLRLRASEAISLGDEIDDAADEAHLAAAWAKVPSVARSLVEEGVSATDVAGVISRELGALTRRAAQIAEASMAADGQGGPPVPYAVVVLGSGGRGESLLSADQDNAIVFAEGQPDGPEDRWFAALAARMNDALNTAGLPHCKGGVMARNPEWRGSLATWRHRIEGWVRKSRPQDLLSVDIFFDLRAVHGDALLARRLLDEAYRLGHAAPDFAKLLAEAGGELRVPIGLFGGLQTDGGRVDLKLGGLLPIVSAARVLAIRHNIVRRGTADRLNDLKATGIGPADDIDGLIEAHRIFIAEILVQQLEDIETGQPPGSKVRAKRLDRAGTDRLLAALKSVKIVPDMVRGLLFG